MRIYQILTYIFLFNIPHVFGWGFAAHKQINRYAVFTLPADMFAFYKHYIAYITEYAVNPDKRRYLLEGEATRHYIDLDYYEDPALFLLTCYWDQAIKVYAPEILLEHGTLPWHIEQMKNALTKAFKQREVVKILKVSTDLGHYLADAQVPLHTTQNYNGQLTNQEGIHGLWETHIPTLFGEDYDFFVGQATYISQTQQKAWETVWQSHQLVDSVLSLEKELSDNFPAMQKYSFEQRGTVLKKVYSQAYMQAYHILLNGQVLDWGIKFFLQQFFKQCIGQQII